MDLISFSKEMGIDFEKIQKLNPEILRWHTDPFQETYRLRVPVGMKQHYAKCCQMKDFMARRFKIYRTKKRVRLEDVARKFGIKTGILVALNKNYSSKKRMSPGSEVLLPFHEEHEGKESFYSDLKRRRRYRNRRGRRRYLSYIRQAKKKGALGGSKVYTVRKGDTLWGVSRKIGVPVSKLIRHNLALLGGGRMIRAGDRLKF